MPLVLTADRGNAILIDTGSGVVRLELVRTRGDRARIWIQAPREMPIWREDRPRRPERGVIGDE